MFNIWKKILKTGVVTKDPIALSPSKKYRGKLFVHINKCNECGKCVTNCPVQAISLSNVKDKTQLSFDYTKCMYCGLCVDVCPEEAIEQTNISVNATKVCDHLYESFIKK